MMQKIGKLIDLCKQVRLSGKRNYVTIGGGKKTEEEPEKKPEEKKEIPLEVRRSMENIYADGRIVKLAMQCKLGDVEAMKRMAVFFRQRCTPELIRLLDRYEENPVKENEDAIDAHVKMHYHEENTVKAYMMWLVRASLYGDAESERKLEAWPFYKKRSFLPYDMLSGKNGTVMNIWASSFLSKIGFIGVPGGYEDCGLQFHKEQGYFDFYYVSDYEPPDEDGFGAEWEYGHIYFDEYFCRLRVKDKSEIPEAIRKMDGRRLRYRKKRKLGMKE